MKESAELVQYLLECSALSLQNFELARLNQAANLQKEMRELLNQFLEHMTAAGLAEILRMYGPEIVGRPTCELFGFAHRHLRRYVQ